MRNVPGGAGLKSTQYMNRKKPDGTTVGPHFTSLVMKELAGVDVPGFDVKELIILGAPTLVDDNYTICADRNKVKSGTTCSRWAGRCGWRRKGRASAVSPWAANSCSSWAVP